MACCTETARCGPATTSAALRGLCAPSPCAPRPWIARAPQRRVQSLASQAASPSSPGLLDGSFDDGNQDSREGSHELELVRLQASKEDPEQPSIASVLPPADAGALADVAVVGAGPAGLALAAELAALGLAVVLVARDAPFVNNYGVWRDEFRDLGLEDTLDAVWDDAVCYFRQGQATRVGRPYGRVCRRRLRARLLERCAAAGVRFLAADVEAVQPDAGGATTTLLLRGGQQLKCRLANLASGAAAGRFLRYEEGAPGVAAQTAYGIEVDVEGYEGAFDTSSMLFMDFRRHHSGLYDGTALSVPPGQHPAGAEGLWGTESEVPSFLYAMPLDGKRVFLEETCLVARPALPFAVLQRRLERRCAALGIKLGEVHEEEWSYIPVGGPLPRRDQPVTAFGAAANLVHPATGYSVARSLREAPAMAAAMRSALREHPGNAAAAAAEVWRELWTDEKRRQAAFHVFGMELLCTLGISSTCDFFLTFFNLPSRYWRGFLASRLSSLELLGFAMTTFVLAPAGIKAKLVGHLITDPSGAYLTSTYFKTLTEPKEEPASR